MGANHGRTGEKNGRWNGGKRSHSEGYIQTSCPAHPRANSCGYVLEHILVLECVIGRFIKEPEEVHHKDGDKKNNHPDNLVLCKDRAHHTSLHVKARALRECGHEDWRKCKICKEYDEVANLIINSLSGVYHRECLKVVNAATQKRRTQRARMLNAQTKEAKA